MSCRSDWPGDNSTKEETLAAQAKTLADALLAVQQGAPTIQKTKINPAFGSKYISLDSLMPQILPLLNDNGLVLTQFPTFIDAPDTVVPALKTRITHVATGEFIEAIAPLMLDKQTAQGLGSAITYMRRYALLSILGLVADVDDDGAEATKAAPKRTTTQRKPSASKQKTQPASPSSDDDW